MKVEDINAETTFEELLEAFPQAAPFFLRWGIRCFACSGVLWGTIAEALVKEEVEDIDAVVEELRSFVLSASQK